MEAGGNGMDAVINRLQRLKEQDLTMLEAWFQDAEVKRRLEGMLPLQGWFSYVQSSLDYFVWAAFSENDPVGVIMIEQEQQEEQSTGSIAIVVNPELRGKGYGRAILTKVMSLPELQHIKRWHAGIEADNAACLKCFQSAGFLFDSMEPDEDGYYSLWY